MTTLKCSRCDKNKPADEFYRNSKSTRGYRWYCKDCQSTYNRSRYVKGSRKERHLSASYNITVEHYQALSQQQNDSCAVCGGTNGGKPLFVDHDHITGAVRGLLCTTCNAGLGMFRDSTELLDRAKAYLSDR